MKEVKEIPQMTKEEMIDYLWDSYKVGKWWIRSNDQATLRLIESLATQLEKEKNNERY